MISLNFYFAQWNHRFMFVEHILYAMNMINPLWDKQMYPLQNFEYLFFFFFGNPKNFLSKLSQQLESPDGILPVWVVSEMSLILVSSIPPH